MIHLDYRDARPIYTQIVDGYKQQIRSGILQPGDKLPSVRELAATLTINPNTIQRAYRELEAGGWIATVLGKGCFACEVPEKVGAEKQSLLQELGDITRRLREMGVSPQEIAEILEQGGDHHA